MSDPRRILIVVNPVAGLGLGRGRAQRLQDRLENAGWAATLSETTPEEDARDRVRERAEVNWDAVAAVGGDGTLQEVVAGLLEKQLDIPVLFVPSGSANVISLTLGLPLRVVDLAELIKTASVRKLDVGFLPDLDRYLLLMATIGFPAEIVRGAPRALKRRLGVFAYLWAAIRRGLRGHQSSSIRIQVDDDTADLQGNTVLATNLGQIPDAGLAVHPHTSPRDGQFDVVVLRGRRWLDSLVAVFDLLLRRHRDSTRIWAAQGAEVRVEADPPLAVQIDGELVGDTPVRLQMLPQAVSLFVPSGKG